MITLKDACKKVLSEHPGQYIHVVNEFEEAYAFVLLNEGEDIRGVTGILIPTTVYKETGEMTDDLLFYEKFYEDVLQGNYKQYKQEELRNL